MASITSTGLGSGIDVSSIVSQLMAVEKQPLVKLQTQASTLQTKISAYGSLKSSISSFQDSVAALLDSSKFLGKTATSSDTTKVTATTTNAASVGSYSIDVYQTARSQILTSKAGTFTSGTQVLASKADLAAAGLSTAKLKFTFGTIGSDGALTENTSATPLTVTLTPDSDGNITLNSVKSAINSSGGTLSATIIKDGTNSARLAISNSKTGEAYGFEMSMLSGGTVGDLSKLAFDAGDATGSFSVVSGNSAQDAKANVNGIDVTNSTNTITDVIEGVTLTLKGNTLATKGDTSSSVATTLTIGTTTTTAAANINAFVKAYNTLATQVTALTKVTPGSGGSSGSSSILTGDAMTRNMMTKIRSMMGARYGSDAAVDTLSDMGISFQKDGTLAVNSTKLTSALESNPDKVSSFFGAYDKTLTTVPVSAKTGFAYKLNEMLDGVLDDDTGSLAGQVTALESQIKLITKREESVSSRLATLEKAYTKQFNAMDSSVGSMKSLSSYLTTQLSNLASLTSSSK